MARQRRKVFVDANNHDRWIVSYADFITLLFAFFVVMYSISSVNEGKYKTLTHSLDTAFSNKGTQDKDAKPLTKIEPTADANTIASAAPLTIPFESLTATQLKMVETAQWELAASPLNEQNPSLDIKTQPSEQPGLAETLTIPFESTQVVEFKEAETKADESPAEAENKSEPEQVEKLAQIDKSSLLDKLTVPFESVESAPSEAQMPPSPETDEKRELSEEILKEREQLNQVSDQLEQSLAPFINDNLITVKRNDYWVELEMNSELLFLSGEAALSAKALPALEKIAETINTLPNALNVEGHTDNVPINNLKFASNWELSSARATSVVQALSDDGVDPTRLSAVGYGEFHPIGDNATEEGRFKNRRVTLVLMSQAFSRYGTNDAERAKLLNLNPTNQNSEAPVNQP